VEYGRNEQILLVGFLAIITLVFDVWYLDFLFIGLVKELINIIAIVKDIAVALKGWVGSFRLLDTIFTARCLKTLVKASLVLEWLLPYVVSLAIGRHRSENLLADSKKVSMQRLNKIGTLITKRIE
jgi:hypothetical protein